MFKDLIEFLYSLTTSDLEDALENFEFAKFFGNPYVIGIMVLTVFLLFTKAKKVVAGLIFYSTIALFILAAVSVFKDPALTVTKAFVMLTGLVVCGLGFLLYRMFLSMD